MWQSKRIISINVISCVAGSHGFALANSGEILSLSCVCVFVHVTKFHDWSVIVIIRSYKSKETGLGRALKDYELRQKGLNFVLKKPQM